MLKVCSQCHETYAGGYSCRLCGPDALLLDVANPDTQRFLAEFKLTRPIRRFYAARRALVQFFIGLPVGIAAALLVFRHGVGVGGEEGTLWKVGAVLLGVGIIGFFIAAGTHHARKYYSTDGEI